MPLGDNNFLKENKNWKHWQCINFFPFFPRTHYWCMCRFRIFCHNTPTYIITLFLDSSYYCITYCSTTPSPLLRYSEKLKYLCGVLCYMCEIRTVAAASNTVVDNLLNKSSQNAVYNTIDKDIGIIATFIKPPVWKFFLTHTL